MSLDFIVAGRAEGISLDVYVHDRLMQLVYDSRASTLYRITDYCQAYGGVQEFAVGELPTLILETAKLAEAAGEDQELRDFFESLASLAGEAFRLASPLRVVGDVG